MITIPKLAEKDLEIFKDKKVIIYGYELSPHPIYRIFKHYNISVIGCCYEHALRFNELKEKIKGVPYVTVDKMPSLIKSNANIIIQGVDFDEQFIKMTREKAISWGVEYSELSAGLLKFSFAPSTLLKQYESRCFFLSTKVFSIAKRLRYTKTATEKRFSSFKKKKILNPIVICSPMKTADHTLNFTFNAINDLASTKRIEYINLHHMPACIDKASCEKEFTTFKLLMGVRCPIEQNLSQLYQTLSSGDYAAFICKEISMGFSTKQREILDELENSLVFNTVDVQQIWDYHVQTAIYPSSYNIQKGVNTKSIQEFMASFKKYVFDIMNYPFNQEKGYAIIKEGNTEVFIYQLEKLDSLVLELSNWIGVPFDKLENANQTSDKWIAESYKQAQKEIEITQEYFDRCFNEPYVKHCYSGRDIEKFKAKWRTHIKK